MSIYRYSSRHRLFCSGANETDRFTIENFCVKTSSEKQIQIVKRPTPARLGTCLAMGMARRAFSSDRVRIGQMISSALGRKVTTHAR